MRGVNGLAAWHCECHGGCDLEAKRVWEPEDDRMIAAPKYGSLLKLHCRDLLVCRTCFPWCEAGVLREEVGM